MTRRSGEGPNPETAAAEELTLFWENELEETFEATESGLSFCGQTLEVPRGSAVARSERVTPLSGRLGGFRPSCQSSGTAASSNRSRHPPLLNNRTSDFRLGMRSLRTETIAPLVPLQLGRAIN